MIGASSLTQRIALGLVVIVLAAASALAAIEIFGYVRLVRGQEAGIYAFEAADLRTFLEAGLNPDGDLTRLTFTQALIDRHSAEDENIQEIVVYDDRGRILFDTDHQRIGASVPAAWARRSPGWLVEAGDDAVTGTPLESAAGAWVGGVAVRYDKSDATERIISVALGVTEIAVLSAGGAALLATIGVWWLLGDARRRLRPITDLSGGLAAASSGAPVPARTGFVDAAAAELARLQRAERLVERLGLRG